MLPRRVNLTADEAKRSTSLDNHEEYGVDLVTRA